MTTPFADLETRLNAAVVARLANATADFGGGVTVDGLYLRPTADAFGLIGGGKPSFQALGSALSGISHGAAVSINSVSYTVAAINLDGTGMTTLELETA